MALEIYKAVADTGGAIGTEISSGVVGELMPEFIKEKYESGITIHRKFYIKNTSAESRDVTVTLGTASVFDSIIFESGGDSEVVGDLTGSETNESPISVTIPASSHVSFWRKVVVPPSSTPSKNYNATPIYLNY